MSKIKNLSKLPFIHIVCGDEDLRPVMQHVFIDNGWAVATDGHVLCAINLKTHTILDRSEIEAMNGKLIHKDMWKLLCEKSVIVHPNENEIEVVFQNGVESVFEYAKNQDDFPNWKAVLTDDKLYSKAINKIGLISSVYAKASLFFKKTFGSNKLDLHFTDESNHILISNGESDVHFLIMPLLVNCELTKGQIRADLD